MGTSSFCLFGHRWSCPGASALLLHRIAQVLGGGIGFAALLLPVHAQVPETWKNTPYVLASDPVPLRQALRDLQTALGIRVDISPGVGGTTQGTGQAQPIQAFVESLAQRHGLTWFVFQDRLYLATRGETASTRVRMDAARAQDARAYLAAIHLLDERFVWLPLATSGEVLVEGPPAYVALVTQKIRNIPPPAPVPVERKAESVELMTFRLQHARAADEDLLIGSGRPGVASLLNRLFNPMLSNLGLGDWTNPQRNAYIEIERQREEMNAQRLAGWPALRGANGAPAAVGTAGPWGAGGAAAAASTLPGAAGTTGAAGMSGMAGIGGGGGVAGLMGGVGGMGGASGTGTFSAPRSYDNRPDDAMSFEADSRLNMVIVRARPSMRAQIESALAALDVPTSQIELEAVVFDLPLSLARSVLGGLSSLSLGPAGGGEMRRTLTDLATAQSVLNRLQAARRSDSSYGVARQRMVFAEDEKFSLDFDNRMALPTYTTTIWEGIAGRLVPLRQRQDSPRSISLKFDGSARVVPRTGIRLALAFTDSRATPDLSEKTVSSQNVNSTVSVTLADAQVLVLSDSMVWSGADMNEPRLRVVFLGARVRPPGTVGP